MTADEILARYRAMYGSQMPENNREAVARLWPTLPDADATEVFLEGYRWAEQRSALAGALGGCDIPVVHALFVGMQLGHIMASLALLEEPRRG